MNNIITTETQTTGSDYKRVTDISIDENTGHYYVNQGVFDTRKNTLIASSSIIIDASLVTITPKV